MSFRSEEILNELTQWFTWLSVSFEAAKAIRHQDPNIQAEYFLRDLLNVVYSWNLANANASLGRSQDAYDLFDKSAGVAVQVTVTTTARRVRKTLKAFVGTYDKEFRRLVFVYPTMTAGASRVNYRDAIANFDFDPKRDRIDLQAILKKVSDLPLPNQEEVLDLARAHLEPLGRGTDLGSRPRIRFSTLPKIRPLTGIIGRAEEIDSMLQAVRSAKSVAITQTIKGGGGVGKTSLAIEVATRVYETKQFNVVAFLNSANVQTLKSKLAELAGPMYLNLPEAGSTKLDEQLDAVLKWFGAPSHCGLWLIIFDGVDDHATKGYVQELLRYLDKGPTIVTSRLDTWGDATKNISLPVFTKDEAVSFLSFRLAQSFKLREEDNVTLLTIADKLGYLPLGLELAAAYMIKRVNLHPRLYLENWDKEFERLVDYKPKSLDYPVGLYLVWRQSVEQLTPSARILLEALACLAPAPYPEECIITSKTDMVPGDLEEMASYSLITRDAATRHILIHKLLNEVTYLRLCREERNAWPLRIAVGMLNDSLPDPAYDESGWKLWNHLYTHCLTVFARCKRSGILRPVDRIMQFVALYCKNRAQYREAEVLFRLSLKTYLADPAAYPKGIGGTRMHNYASLLATLGKLHEAREMYEQAIACDIREFGPDHPNTIPKLNSLGELYARTGNARQSIELIEKALAHSQGAYGENCADNAVYMNNLSLRLLEQGRIEEAETYAKRAYEIDLAHFGESHPRIATRLNTLAAIRERVGNLQGAELLYIQSMDILRQTLGESEPLYSKTLNNLGLLFKKQGRHGEAQSLLETALTLLSRSLGRNNPTTLSVARNLEGLLKDRGWDVERIAQRIRRLL